MKPLILFLLLVPSLYAQQKYTFLERVARPYYNKYDPAPWRILKLSEIGVEVMDIYSTERCIRNNPSCVEGSWLSNRFDDRWKNYAVNIGLHYSISYLLDWGFHKARYKTNFYGLKLGLVASGGIVISRNWQIGTR